MLKLLLKVLSVISRAKAPKCLDMFTITVQANSEYVHKFYQGGRGRGTEGFRNQWRGHNLKFSIFSRFSHYFSKKYLLNPLLNQIIFDLSSIREGNDKPISFLVGQEVATSNQLLS